MIFSVQHLLIKSPSTVSSAATRTSDASPRRITRFAHRPGRWVFTSSRGGGYSHHPSTSRDPRMFWRARVDRSPPSSSPSRLPSRVRRATSLLVRGHRRHDVLRPVESTTSFGARVAPSEPELRPSPPRARARAQSHASSRHPAPRPEFATRPSRQPRASALARRRKRPRKPEPDTRIRLGRSTGHRARLHLARPNLHLARSDVNLARPDVNLARPNLTRVEQRAQIIRVPDARVASACRATTRDGAAFASSRRRAEFDPAKA